MAGPLSFKLTDKVVVVTGASRGIGKAIAESCAHYGAHLALGSRHVEESAAVAESCRHGGRRAAAWPLDVSRVDSIKTFVEQVLEAYGRIDVLVNNAGYALNKPAVQYTEQEYDAIMACQFEGRILYVHRSRAEHDRPRHSRQHHHDHLASRRGRRAAAQRLWRGQERRRSFGSWVRRRVGTAQDHRQRRCANVHAHAHARKGAPES